MTPFQAVDYLNHQQELSDQIKEIYQFQNPSAPPITQFNRPNPKKNTVARSDAPDAMRTKPGLPRTGAREITINL